MIVIRNMWADGPGWYVSAIHPGVIVQTPDEDKARTFRTHEEAEGACAIFGDGDHISEYYRFYRV